MTNQFPRFALLVTVTAILAAIAGLAAHSWPEPRESEAEGRASAGTRPESHDISDAPGPVVAPQPALVPLRTEVSPDAKPDADEAERAEKVVRTLLERIQAGDAIELKPLFTPRIVRTIEGDEGWSGYRAACLAMFAEQYPNMSMDRFVLRYSGSSTEGSVEFFLDDKLAGSMKVVSGVSGWHIDEL